MWPFKRNAPPELEAWPIVRSKPIGKTYGRSISVFINNMQGHLTTVDVYEDGSVDCWGFVDLALFVGKLESKWVVPAPKPKQAISVFNFGYTGVQRGKWVQTARGIEKAVRSVVRELNPEMRNLIDMQGSDTELRGKVRYAKMRRADKKPYRMAEGTGEEVLGDRVPILCVQEQGYVLTRLVAYADGMCQLGPSGALVPVADLPSLYESNQIANSAPAGSLIRLPGLGEFHAANSFGGVSVHDRIAEINDMISELNGEPSIVRKCADLFAQYEQNPSPQAKDALRVTYEAVPTHLRSYCGDMDTRDTAIRAVLYGEV